MIASGWACMAKQRGKASKRALRRRGRPLGASPGCGAALYAAVTSCMVLAACRKASPADWAAVCTEPPAPLELTLEAAVPIEPGDAGLPFDTSGLLLEGDQLLAVSDKHDDTVFALHVEATVARARPLVRFTVPGGYRLDLEGLTRGADGSLLLVSEAQKQLYRVTAAGEFVGSLGALEPMLSRAGLCEVFNAGLEGAARLPDGRLLIVAERAPRGLIELAGDSPSGARAWTMAEARCPARAPRNDDFADVTTFEGAVYVLERNAHLVVRIEQRGDGWVEREAWSYAQAENDPRFRYVDRTYGLAEGLAVDREHVYVALDNNAQARSADPKDQRPLLMIFRRPS